MAPLVGDVVELVPVDANQAAAHECPGTAVRCGVVLRLGIGVEDLGKTTERGDAQRPTLTRRRRGRLRRGLPARGGGGAGLALRWAAGGGDRAEDARARAEHASTA